MLTFRTKHCQVPKISIHIHGELKSSIQMGFSFILLYPFTLLNNSIPSCYLWYVFERDNNLLFNCRAAQGTKWKWLKKIVVHCKMLLSTLWRFEALHSYYLAGLLASILFLVPSIHFPDIHGSEFSHTKLVQHENHPQPLQLKRTCLWVHKHTKPLPQKGWKQEIQRLVQSRATAFIIWWWHRGCLLPAESCSAFPALRWGSSPLIPGRELQTLVSYIWAGEVEGEREMEEKR